MIVGMAEGEEDKGYDDLMRQHFDGQVVSSTHLLHFSQLSLFCHLFILYSNGGIFY